MLGKVRTVGPGRVEAHLGRHLGQRGKQEYKVNESGPAWGAVRAANG